MIDRVKMNMRSSMYVFLVMCSFVGQFSCKLPDSEEPLLNDQEMQSYMHKKLPLKNINTYMSNKPSLDDYELKSGDVAISTSFYSAVANASDARNFLVSPYGLKILLSMISFGVEEEKARSIALGMHLDPDKDYLTAISSQFDDINLIPSVKCASKLWVQEGMMIKDLFSQQMQYYFHTPVNYLNFMRDSETARQHINRYISVFTSNKINNLLRPDSITSDTKAILLSALYFKENWKYEFEKASEEKWKNIKVDSETPHFFNSIAKTNTELDKESIMFRDANLLYFTLIGPTVTKRNGETRAINIDVVELPYKDEACSMIILLPDGEGSPSKNYRSLEGNIDKILPRILKDLDKKNEEGSVRNIELIMPSFRTEWDGKLIPIFPDMGLESVRNIQLKELTSEPGITINNIIQKTFIQVGLHGTEAAAVTVADALARMLPSSPPRIILNRSFIYLIRENSTGAILFIGRFMEP